MISCLHFFKKVTAILILLLSLFSMGVVSEQDYKNTVLTPGDKLIIDLFK